VFATEARRLGLTVDQMLEGAATTTLLKRLPTLDDLTATLVFLASDGAAGDFGCRGEHERAGAGLITPLKRSAGWSRSKHSMSKFSIW
jgi:hypothetical protein